MEPEYRLSFYISFSDCYTFDAKFRWGGAGNQTKDAFLFPPGMITQALITFIFYSSLSAPSPCLLSMQTMCTLLKAHSKSQFLIIPLPCSSTSSLPAGSRTKSNSSLTLRSHWSYCPLLPYSIKIELSSSTPSCLHIHISMDTMGSTHLPARWP